MERLFPGRFPADSLISSTALAVAGALKLDGLRPSDRGRAIDQAANLTNRMWEDMRGRLVEDGGAVVRFDVLASWTPELAGAPVERFAMLLLALVSAGDLRRTLLAERARIDAVLASLPPESEASA